MTCNEFERLLPDYLTSKLDYCTMEAFLEHMNTCSSCKEELTIQFLVTDGLKALEEERVFDLDQALEKRLHDSNRLLKRYKRNIRIRYDFVVALLIIIGILIIYMV